MALEFKNSINNAIYDASQMLRVNQGLAGFLFEGFPWKSLADVARRKVTRFLPDLLIDSARDETNFPVIIDP